jgi:hypothetical protein
LARILRTVAWTALGIAAAAGVGYGLARVQLEDPEEAVPAVNRPRPASGREPAKREPVTRAQRMACRPGPRLTWRPPALNDAVHMTVETGTNRIILDDAKDYRIDLGGGEVLRSSLRISGGHDVVIIGGRFDLPGPGDVTHPGLSIRRQSDGGVVHVEGVRFSGSLYDAITLEQPNDTAVQIENVRVDELHATDEVEFTDSHPDIIQTWTGPKVLRVDRLTGYSPYQGLFLEPDDDLYEGPGAHNITRLADVRNVNIRTRADLDKPHSRFLWQSTPFKLRTKNLWIDPGTQETIAYPNLKAWGNVRRGVPATGDFVRGAPGVDYRSPGYGKVRQPSGQGCRPQR